MLMRVKFKIVFGHIAGLYWHIRCNRAAPIKKCSFKCIFFIEKIKDADIITH